MCGRYEFTPPLGKEFDFVQWPDIQAHLDICPTNDAPVILLNAQSQYEVQLRK